MEIKIETATYNERRYGKPWIAKVSFEKSKKGDFTFGEWVGRPGQAGELYINADPGDIIAQGQKNHRKPRNSVPYYYLVNASGTLEGIGESVIEARKVQAEFTSSSATYVINRYEHRHSVHGTLREAFTEMTDLAKKLKNEDLMYFLDSALSGEIVETLMTLSVKDGLRLTESAIRRLEG